MTSRYPAIAPDILNLFAARGAACGRGAGAAAGRPVPRHGRRGSAPPHLPDRERDRRDAVPAARNSPFPSASTTSPRQAGTPRRYAYLGEVFRQRREGGNEFFQAGIEDLGDRDTAAADARSLADAHALLSLALPGATLTVTLGDQTIFEAVLAALGLPRGWRMRLARAFGSADMLAAALADLANPAAQRRAARAGRGACRRRRSRRACPRTSPAAWSEAGLSPIGRPHARTRSRGG